MNEQLDEHGIIMLFEPKTPTSANKCQPVPTSANYSGWYSQMKKVSLKGSSCVTLFFFCIFSQLSFTEAFKVAPIKPAMFGK